MFAYNPEQFQCSCYMFVFPLAHDFEEEKQQQQKRFKQLFASSSSLGRSHSHQVNIPPPLDLLPCNQFYLCAQETTTSSASVVRQVIYNRWTLDLDDHARPPRLARSIKSKPPALETVHANKRFTLRGSPNQILTLEQAEGERPWTLVLVGPRINRFSVHLLVNRFENGHRLDQTLSSSATGVLPMIIQCLSSIPGSPTLLAICSARMIVVCLQP